MSDTHDAAEPRRRLLRRPCRVQADQPRRRLQFGTGYPHRGPAPAYAARQRAYEPARAGGAAMGESGKAGRLRVLDIPAERDGARPGRFRSRST